MVIYFAFSDESGNYQQTRSKDYKIKEPFYARATILLDANKWSQLNNDFMDIKSKYGFKIENEIKWSYLWSIWKHKHCNVKITEDKPYFFLKDVNKEALLNFIEESLGLLKSNNSKIIITVFSNYSSIAIEPKTFYKMHLQDLMQRIEMELQSDDNLCVLFIDPVSLEKDVIFREIYHELYLKGDFIKKYAHIKDSLNIELSHHSVGIQLADYVSGIFTGFLRGYSDSTALFEKCILNLLRESDSINISDFDLEKGTLNFNADRILGYGIIDVPKEEEFRKFLKDLLNKIGKPIKFR